MKKIYIQGAAVTAVLTLILAAALYTAERRTPFRESKKETASVHMRESRLTNKKAKTSAVIGAVGDILLHDVVYEDACRHNRCQFDQMFSGVKSYMQNPDLLIANQESMIGGSELGLSSYPSFNSPYEIADTLKRMGVDLVTISNNHSMDHGEKALQRAIAHYENINMPYTGAYKDKKDSGKLRIITKKGISFGFLSYTYGLNGNSLPAGKPYMVNLFTIDKALKDIREARTKVDAVVVSTHWGSEYERLPADDQKNWARMMAEAGADIIIGHHPHVLQPIEWIEHGDRRSLAVYSLGNFLSGQFNDFKDIGGILSVTVSKEKTIEAARISIDSFQFTPTFTTSSNRRNFRIFPLLEAEEMGLLRKKESYTETMAHMTRWIK
ncbi:CapA family protein [Peribacillus sp. SCS-37]|uniref:CapA family protein n=1 Tax=Paraperibacillus esterisolvens TaxID=3115296 RepID=UPI003905A8FD